MGRPRRVTCIVCGFPPPEGTELSNRYKCINCGPNESARQQREMAEHRGYHYQRWRARTCLSLGIPVPEELQRFLERD